MRKKETRLCSPYEKYGVIEDSEALECAEKLIWFCNQQDSCEECVFGKQGNGKYECIIQSEHEDLDEAREKFKAKL